MNNTRFDDEEEIGALIIVFTLFVFIGIIFDISMTYTLVWVIVLLLWSTIYNLYLKKGTHDEVEPLK